MAGAIDVIKSYLVSLGFSVDKSSYDDTQKKLDSFEKKITSFGEDAVKTFGQAATAVTAFGVAAAAGIAKFLDTLGNQETSMEKLSRQLWTTQQQAMAFNATLKAMGANLQDLYLSPTLMQQYQQLHAVAMQMQTPSDYNKQIQMVQSVQVQIKQMRLEAYYALQWIGYYFIKYMEGPISKVHDVLQSINEVIVKNMPTWTKRVAEVMASFVQAGIYIGQALSTVYTWLKKMLAYVPGWAKGIAAALAIFGLSNPFMLFVEAIGGAILLLDDFETYIHGGTSALAPFWAWLMKVVGALKQMGVGKDIANGVQSAFQWLGKTLQDVAHFVAVLYKTFEQNGTIKAFIDVLKIGWKVEVDIFNAIGNLITGIGHLFGLFNNTSGQNNMINFFQLLADTALGAVKILYSALEEVYGLVNSTGDALHGNWSAALKDVNNIFTGQNLANVGIISQSHVLGSKGPPIGPPSWNSWDSSQTKTVHVTANQTNHIHGTNPYGTSNAIQSGFNRNLHNIRGVIG